MNILPVISSNQIELITGFLVMAIDKIINPYSEFVLKYERYYKAGSIGFHGNAKGNYGFLVREIFLTAISPRMSLCVAIGSTCK